MHEVTILTFNEPEDAAPVKQRLTEAGVKSEIYDERNLQKYWFMSENLAGIRVRVDRSDYDRAKHLLGEWKQQEPALEKAIHCPSCGSSRVEYPQFTRKFLSSWFYALACALGLFEKKFYCQECHFTWPMREKLAQPTDTLGWPKKQA